MMHWTVELQMLLVRFSSYGAGHDLAALTLAERWGLYCYLRRIAAGGGHV